MSILEIVFAVVVLAAAGFVLLPIFLGSFVRRRERRHARKMGSRRTDKIKL